VAPRDRPLLLRAGQFLLCGALALVGLLLSRLSLLATLLRLFPTTRGSAPAADGGEHEERENRDSRHDDEHDDPGVHFLRPFFELRPQGLPAAGGTQTSGDDGETEEARRLAHDVFLEGEPVYVRNGDGA
jgi:hypothetical protein